MNHGVWMAQKGVRVGLRLGCGLLVAMSAVACAVNPATGKREFSLIGEAREIELGREADPAIVASMGLHDDPELAKLVESLGSSLAARSERPTLPWSFKVLDDPLVNAFALPGGFIYVTRGILAHFNSEAELVGVLGHEIGHVTARHSVSQLSRQQLTRLGLGITMALEPGLQNFSGFAEAGLGLLSLKYGRDDERQADALGFRYMRRLDYDPRALGKVFEMLGRVSGGGPEGTPGWLSTHPQPEDRAEALGRLLAESGADFSGSLVRENEYLKMLDGMVFGADPRAGYFAGSAFHHPELAFTVDFPTGWRGLNARDAVQAMHPDGDAALLLTVETSGSSPGLALAQFLGQKSVTAGRSWEDPINGLPAAWSDFSVAVEGGTLRGTLVFIAHRGATFRLLGYAASARWSERSPAVLDTLASFREERDPAVLSVEPSRIEIVELGAAMTMTEFATRFPSSISPAEVALINQRTLPETVPAGTLLKRVVGGVPRP